MANRVITFLTFTFLVGAVQGESSENPSSDHFDAEDYEEDNGYCVYDPNQLFYQNRETGTICCRGRVLPMVNVIKPEVTGDCAISTKTKSNGTLKSAPLVRFHRMSTLVIKQNILFRRFKVIPSFLQLYSFCSGVLTRAN